MVSFSFPDFRCLHTISGPKVRSTIYASIKSKRVTEAGAKL